MMPTDYDHAKRAYDAEMGEAQAQAERAAAGVRQLALLPAVGA